MEYIEQGRYIRSIENLPISTQLKLKSYYPLTNPIQQIEEYIKYFNDSHSMLHLQWWQAVIEESIDLFEGIARTNYLSKNDAYQILKTSICDFVKVSNELKQYVTKMLEMIHQSPKKMSEILMVKYVCRHNIHFVSELLIHLLRSNIDDTLKNDVLIQYMNNVEYIFDIDKQLLYEVYLQYRTVEQFFDNTPIGKIRTHLMLHYIHNNIGIVDISELLKILSTHEDMLISQYLLAIISCETEHHYYSKQQLGIIFKKLYELPTESVGKCFEEHFIDKLDCLCRLAQLCIDKTTDVLTDVELHELIKKEKDMRGGTVLVKYQEMMYLQGRLPNYQKVTIANNSDIVLKYVIKYINTTDEFILLPTQRKIYEDFRKIGVKHMEMKIYMGDTLWINRNYVDINSYVTVYGHQPKFMVYFEKDESLESMNPTTGMIQDVAMLLRNKYEETKNDYPTMKIDDFIKTIACIGVNEYVSPFLGDLNSLMRPTQLRKAIDIILGTNC